MNTIVVKEQVMDVVSDSQQNHIVYSGCQRSTQQVLSAQSSQLNPSPPQQTTFVYNPPSLQSVVDREIYVKAYLDVVVNQPLVFGVEDCLRAFPLNSITNITSVSINGESVSDNSGEKLAPLLTYGVTSQELDRTASTTPAQPDSYQQYNSWVTEGSARNPACFYGENSGCVSRGSFELEILSPTHFRCVVSEPLFISPLSQGFHGKVEGMVNVSELVVVLTHSQNVGRILSHSSNGNPITVVSTTFYRVPELLLTICTPPIDQPIPSLQQLPYQKPNQYVREMGNIAPGATQNIYSDTVRLSLIPEYIYLFAKHSQSTESFATSDSFLSIENVSVSWGNDTGILANASKEQLFQICQKNGCTLSWPAWSRFRGGVMAIRLGAEIGLQPFEAPGLSGSYTIQVNITFKNQSASTFNGSFYLVTMNSGVFSIAANVGRASLGGLTPEIILEARRSGRQMSHADYKRLSGGSFWTSLKSIINKVSGALAPVLGAVNPALGQIATGVRDLTGSGVPRAVMSDMSSGGRVVGGRQIRRR